VPQLGGMDMRKLVGRNFERLRKEKGFTQEQFAEASGFSQQYLSDLERGRRNPTVISLFHLSSALGTEPFELLRPDQQATAEGLTAPPKKTAIASPGRTRTRPL